MNPPHGDLVLSWVSICASPNLDILGVKFVRKLTFEDHLRGIVSRVSRIWYFDFGEECLSGDLCVASLLLCIWSPNPWVLFFGVIACCWMSSSAARTTGVFGGRLCLDQSFLSLCHPRHIAAMCMLYKVNWNWKHCLFCDVPCASLRAQHTRGSAAANPLKFEVIRWRTIQFLWCFLPAQTRVWITFPTLCLTPERWMGLREQSIFAFFPELCFSVFRCAGACVVAKSIYEQFCFSHLLLCCWFW